MKNGELVDGAMEDLKENTVVKITYDDDKL